MDNEIILKDLEEVAAYNKLEIEKSEGDQNLAKNIITFTHEETSIYDPFSDESIMSEVNPIEYYGMKKVLKMIKEFKNKTNRSVLNE